MGKSPGWGKSTFQQVSGLAGGRARSGELTGFQLGHLVKVLRESTGHPKAPERFFKLLVNLPAVLAFSRLRADDSYNEVSSME